MGFSLKLKCTLALSEAAIDGSSCVGKPDQLEMVWHFFSKFLGFGGFYLLLMLDSMNHVWVLVFEVFWFSFGTSMIYDLRGCKAKRFKVWNDGRWPSAHAR